MKERIERLCAFTRNKRHARHRREQPIELTADLEGKSYMKRVAVRFKRLLEAEKPVFLPDERIVFTRTTVEIPEVYTPNEMVNIRKGRFCHEMGRVFNICSDFDAVISEGLLSRRAVAVASLKGSKTAEKAEFLESAIETIDAVLGLAKRYSRTAREEGLTKIAETLERVPSYGARTFAEALQSLRILHSCLYLAGHYHCGLGRFDQYMWPYLKDDLDTGRLDEEDAEELLQEFFISLNRDSDLYPGVQQGDNGQSLILGGCDGEGNDAVNPLTYMCLRASRELGLIDPKINLRVSRRTDLGLFKLATELTARGLGFPQYANDDVVIPGLVAAGYSLQDARNYTVAACWEFIVPGVGMDIPNINAVSLASAADSAIRKGLGDGGDFDRILSLLRQEIRRQVDAKCEEIRNIVIEPAPYQSVLMTGCLERGADISTGGKYNNYGFHGTGLANAVDQLAAVKKLVLDEHHIPAADFLTALDKDFKGLEDLRLTIVRTAPRMGHNDATTNELAREVSDMFIDALKGRKNERGGCIRAGFGSAMYYLTHGRELGATADSRGAGEPLSANLAPSLETEAKGPVSVIKSFAGLNYLDAPNGGPLTMEIDSSVFRASETIEKMAMFVRSYIFMGGQQFQLNAISREELVHAQTHPYLHKNLVVRVWGWSGYFCELDRPYQNHIIARTVY